MTTVSDSSQSNGEFHPGSWSNSSIKLSSPVTCHDESWACRLFSLLLLQRVICHSQILLMKMHCHAESLASSGCYTFPQILPKSVSWHPYLPTHPYLILLVVIPGMTVLLLGKYGYLFCCINFLCDCFFLCLLFSWLILKFFATIISHILIASGILHTYSVGLSILQL